MQNNLKNQRQVILYHHVSDVPSSFVKHLGIVHYTDSFKKQIEFLSKTHALVSFSEFVSSDNSSKKICLTFDDGYKSFRQFALPVLEHFSVPVKMYLNSSAVFGDIPWLNKLSCLIDTLSKEELLLCAQKALGIVLDTKVSIVRQFVDNFQSPVTHQIVDRYYLDYCKETVDPRLFLDRNDLQELRDHPLIEWGSHSINHWPLDRLDKNTIHSEITHGHRELQQILGDRLNGVSIPFSRFSGKEFEIFSAIESITDTVALGAASSRKSYSFGRLKFTTRTTAPFSCRKLRILMGKCNTIRYRSYDSWYKKTRTIRYSELESYVEYVHKLPTDSLIPITASRARVMCLNPYAAGDDPALIVIEDAEKGVVAYWGLMSSVMMKEGESRKMFWSSTGAIMPHLRGRGPASAMFRRITEEVELFCARGNSKGAQGMFRYLGLTEKAQFYGFDLIISRLNPFVFWEEFINWLKGRHVPAALGGSSPVPSLADLGARLRSIFYLLGVLTRLRIKWCESRFSDQALRFMEAGKDNCFYRSGEVIEWMASNPLSQDTIESNRLEESYYFSPRHRQVYFLRLEAAFNSPDSIAAVALFSLVRDTRNHSSKLMVLDSAYKDWRGNLIVLIAAILAAVRAGAHKLHVPRGLIPNTLLKLFPRCLGRYQKESYFYYCKDGSFMDDFTALNPSLADGDIGLA